MGRLFLIVAALILLFFFLRSCKFDRITVVLSGDPVVVWSWDTIKNRGVIVRIPKDTRIEAVRGYGIYPVSSLWELGKLNNDSTLLADSIGVALGIPVSWYVGPTSLPPFSSRGTIGRITTSIPTNIPLRIWLQLVRIQSNMTPINTVSLDLSESSGLKKMTLPDGSESIEIDTVKLDTLIGNEFEDIRVRQEAIPLGVYNTTTMPTLGGRMARVVSHLGGNVVIVGNSTHEVSQTCQLTGKSNALSSVTITFLARQLGCSVVSNFEGNLDEQVDIILFVGRPLLHQLP